MRDRFSSKSLEKRVQTTTIFADFVGCMMLFFRRPRVGADQASKRVCANGPDKTQSLAFCVEPRLNKIQHRIPRKINVFWKNHANESPFGEIVHNGKSG